MLFGTHNRLPSYLQRNLGWARGAAGGRPPPWARHHIPGLFPSPSGPPPGATLGSVGAQAQRGVLTCPALLRGLVGRFLTPRKGRGAQGNVGAPRPWKKGKPFGYSSIAAACPKPLNLGFTKGTQEMLGANMHWGAAAGASAAAGS